MDLLPLDIWPSVLKYIAYPPKNLYNFALVNKQWFSIFMSTKDVIASDTMMLYHNVYSYITFEVFLNICEEYPILLDIQHFKKYCKSIKEEEKYAKHRNPYALSLIKAAELDDIEITKYLLNNAKEFNISINDEIIEFFYNYYISENFHRKFYTEDGAFIDTRYNEDGITEQDLEIMSDTSQINQNFVYDNEDNFIVEIRNSEMMSCVKNAIIYNSQSIIRYIFVTPILKNALDYNYIAECTDYYVSFHVFIGHIFLMEIYDLLHKYLEINSSRFFRRLTNIYYEDLKYEDINMLLTILVKYKALIFEIPNISSEYYKLVTNLLNAYPYSKYCGINEFINYSKYNNLITIDMIKEIVTRMLKTDQTNEYIICKIFIKKLLNLKQSGISNAFDVLYDIFRHIADLIKNRIYNVHIQNSLMAEINIEDYYALKSRLNICLICCLMNNIFTIQNGIVYVNNRELCKIMYGYFEDKPFLAFILEDDNHLLATKDIKKLHVYINKFSSSGSIEYEESFDEFDKLNKFLNKIGLPTASNY